MDDIINIKKTEDVMIKIQEATITLNDSKHRNFKIRSNGFASDYNKVFCYVSLHFITVAIVFYK